MIFKEEPVGRRGRMITEEE